MKKNYIALGAIALTIISTIGLASATMASGKNNDNNGQKNKTAYEHNDKLTDAQKATIAANRTANQAKETAIKAALAANDYNAWVKAVGSDSPILKKINATNFSRLVDAYKLRVQANDLEKQANTIMTDLGLESGQGRGMGMGLGMGLHLGWNK
jgi:GH24 family phage-related lysozyme (muramidase)